MTHWIASPDFAMAENGILSLPQMWASLPPETRGLFPADRLCFDVYELYGEDESRQMVHHVAATYLPSCPASEVCESLLDLLCNELKQHVRTTLAPLAFEERNSVDAAVSCTSWSAPENRLRFSVTRDDRDLPQIVVDGHVVDTDFNLLIADSSLSELCALSSDVWSVNRTSCVRYCDGRVSTNLQAKEHSGELLRTTLDRIGFEERQNGVWWKGRVAVRPLDRGYWAAVHPAPSFLRDGALP